MVPGLKKYLETGATVNIGRLVETMAQRQDGSQFPVELTVTRVGEQVPVAVCRIYSRHFCA